MVVITAGTIESGKKWQQNTGIKFPLLANSDWSLYRMLGCKRNVSTVHTIKNMAGYAEAAIAGNLLTPESMYDGDDVHIMAGDYIVNKEGKFLYAHPTKTPQDRPSVDHLLTVATGLQ